MNKKLVKLLAFRKIIDDELKEYLSKDDYIDLILILDILEFNIIRYVNKKARGN